MLNLSTVKPSDSDDHGNKKVVLVACGAHGSLVIGTQSSVHPAAVGPSLHSGLTCDGLVSYLFSNIYLLHVSTTETES